MRFLWTTSHVYGSPLWEAHLRLLPCPCGSYPDAGVPIGAVYDWIEKKHLDAQRGPDGRLRVTFSAEVLQACQQRIANSHHLKPQTRKLTVGAAV